MSASIRNNDAKVAKKRRKPLKNDPEANLKVEVDLRDKIVRDLFRKLNEDNYGQSVVERWNVANAERQEWLERQETLLADYDEFLESTAEGPFEQASSLHLPMPFIVIKTLHARFLQALLGADPPFQVTARNDASVQRAPVMQELLRYMVDKHMNRRDGVFKPLDLWIWSWASTGSGLMKVHWDRKFIKYKDVEEEFVPGMPTTKVGPDGEEILQATAVKKEKEVDKKELLWEGPVASHLFSEDVAIIGEENNDDPQTADEVIHRRRLTASHLWSFVDQGIFDRENVAEIIKGGPDSEFTDQASNIKQQRVDNAGQRQLNSPAKLTRYTILESYSKKDVDGSGIASDIVTWVHAKTKKILRSTYLHRINKNGKRPIFKIDFLRRPGQPYGMGLAEILHPLSVEMDAMHNMRIDFGLLSTMPFGFYRPSSSIDPKIIKIEPGSLIPVDDPQRDVFFPTFGNRTAFGHQEEASLQSWSERLTGISDLSLGVMTGTQGATRTATGTRALVGELSANLDVFLRRLNEGWKQVLEFITDLLQQRLPKNFVFKVTADADFATNWAKIGTREEIRGDYDVDVSPNSATSNQQIQEQRSNEILQLTSNPLDFQLGIITPLERYEALKNALKVRGIKDVSRFIRRPEGMEQQLTPEEEANRVLRGIAVPVTPQMDHIGFIKYIQQIQQDDLLAGQFTDEAIIMLAAQAQRHQQMIAALQQMAAQSRNQQQLQTNRALGQVNQPAFPLGGGGVANA